MAKLKCKHSFQKITGLFYYNYYQFHDPRMLLMEGNTMIILDTLKKYIF